MIYVKAYMLVAVLALFLVAACTTQTNTNEQTPPVEQMEETPETNEPEMNEPEEQETTPENSVLDMFQNFAMEYKVTYDFTMTGTAALAGTQVMAVKAGKIRTDIITDEMTSSTYLMDGTAYTCTDASGNMMCLSIQLDEQQLADMQREQNIRENPAEYTITPAGTRVIAGATATCFLVTVEQGTVEYCYSADGAPLYIKTTAGDIVSEMTATSYSTSVADSEFVLPAEPTAMNLPDLSNLPQMG